MPASAPRQSRSKPASTSGPDESSLAQLALEAAHASVCGLENLSIPTAREVFAIGTSDERTAVLDGDRTPRAVTQRAAIGNDDLARPSRDVWLRLRRAAARARSPSGSRPPASHGLDPDAATARQARSAPCDQSPAFRSMRTDLDGLSVHAMVSDGPKPHGRLPLVLVHGLGLSHRYMMPTAKRLARDFPVYVPDLPGFGDSDHPHRVLDISGLADALLAWMDAAGLGRVAMLGNSHGCQIIIDLAARHPQRVIRAIIQGPTIPSGERTWLWQLVRWRQSSRHASREHSRPAWRDYRKAGYFRILRTIQYALADRPEDKAPRVTASTLVVRGERDPLCRRDWAEDLARRMPNGRVAFIPDAAHALVFAAPEELAAMTRAFLLEQPA